MPKEAKIRQRWPQTEEIGQEFSSIPRKTHKSSRRGQKMTKRVQQTIKQLPRKTRKERYHAKGCQNMPKMAKSSGNGRQILKNAAEEAKIFQKNMKVWQIRGPRRQRA